MIAAVQFGCALALVTAMWAGKRANTAYHMLLVSLLLGLVILHLQLRPVNYFRILDARPDVKDTLSIRIAVKRLERSGNQAFANEVRQLLLNDKSRINYLFYGERGFQKLKNEGDYAEFFVRVVGPILLWYLEALLAIAAVHFSKFEPPVLGVGFLILFCLAGFEIVAKTSSGISFDFLPYDTPYDIVELSRVLAACLFIVYTYIRSMEAFDWRMDSYKTALRILRVNEKILEQD